MHDGTHPSNHDHYGCPAPGWQRPEIASAPQPAEPRPVPPPPLPPSLPPAPPVPPAPDDGDDRVCDEISDDGFDARSALAREAVQLAKAVRAARGLTLAALRLTNGRGGARQLAAQLRRHAAGTALGLESGTPAALLQALRSLWRVSDLVDQAERDRLLTLDEAVELLTLGSQVEIPLVAVLRPCGFGLASG